MAGIRSKISVRALQQSYNTGVAAGEGYRNAGANQAPIDDGSAIEFTETIEGPPSFTEQLNAMFHERTMDEQYPIVEDQPVYFNAEFGEYFNDTPSTASPYEQAEIVDDHVFEFEYQYSKFVEGQTDVNTLLSENQRIRGELQTGYRDIMSQQDTQTALDNYDRRAQPYVQLEIESNRPELETQFEQDFETITDLYFDVYDHPFYESYTSGDGILDPDYQDLPEDLFREFEEKFLSDLKTLSDSYESYNSLALSLGQDDEFVLSDDYYEIHEIVQLNERLESHVEFEITAHEGPTPDFGDGHANKGLILGSPPPKQEF